MSENRTQNPARILLIDDTPDVRAMMRMVLQSEGYEVEELSSVEDLECVAETFHPQLIICDLLMPGRDGLSVVQDLQEREETRHIPIILATAKDFAGDKRAAMQAGASNYLVKPFTHDVLLEAVEMALQVKSGVRVWGCRGSVAAPEKALGHYGGNTSCVELVLPSRDGGPHRVIFDAGTGIRALGNSIAPRSPLRASLFLTHFHWDHIQGLPFFKPMYRPGNDITIYGPAPSDTGLLETIQSQMGGAFFPISTDAFSSSVKYVGLQEQTIEAAGLEVSTCSVMHPGFTLGYKVNWSGQSIAYVPDNELMLEWVEPELSGEALRFASWLEGTSLLLHDCQSSSQGYEDHRGWGHSGPAALAAVCAHANVKRVLLFHHDPDHEDDIVNAINAELRECLDKIGASHIVSEPAAESTFYSL